MLNRVRRAIQRHHLLVPGETVVVGVSGGPDSLCLLHVLRELSPELSLSLHVAHLNHHIRGEDADADAAFVAALAASWGLPATLGAADVPAFARAHKLAPEEAARRARYAFLARVAEQVGARTIAVAHNADDQTETVLMHWLRGSGLAGLRGMLPATQLEEMRLEIGSWKMEDGSWKLEAPSPTSSFQPPTSNLKSLILIRPLLDIPRADVEAYCAAHSLQPRFDRSNLDTTYYRNRLRHDLLPILETYNVNIRQVLRRSAAVIAADYDLLREQLEVAWKRVVRGESDQAVTFDLDDWRALPPSLQRSTLREAIHRLRRALRNIDFVHVENAVEILSGGLTGDQATLPQGLMLTIGYDSFTVAGEDYRALPDLPLLPGGELLPVALPGRTRLPGAAWTLHAELLPRAKVSDAALAAPRGWQARLDAAALGTSPVLRVRRPGDRFCPLGMGGRGKRVNEFMINEKIPAAWRDHVPLLTNADGQIAWVCGWRPDERARVAAGTQRVAWLHFERS
jgi:tRNA(Ile)-lysidine synthetase-like protein